MSEADPHKVYNVHDAKTNLSRLIDRANAGEEIIIAKAGKPYARLMPLEPERRHRRTPGRFRHLLKDVPSNIWFEPTFTDEELDEFERKLGNG